MARMARAMGGSWHRAFTRRRFSAREAGLVAANSLPMAMSSPDHQEFSRHRGRFSPRPIRRARASLACMKAWKVSI